jgi:hypothetical protein
MFNIGARLRSLSLMVGKQWIVKFVPLHKWGFPPNRILTSLCWIKPLFLNGKSIRYLLVTW